MSEVQHGNEVTYREMLRIKRSVFARYSQTLSILPEHLMRKDQTVNLDEAKDKLKEAGFHDNEITALEMQLAPAGCIAVTTERKVGFVSARLESQSDGTIKTSANHEDIELPDESDSDDDDKTEIAQKEVPSAVFGGLIRKIEDNENTGEADGANKNQLGALERIKRMKRN